VRSDLGDKQGAIDDYNRAIEINPKNASAFYNRGAIESELGDRQASASDYDRSVLLNPQYAEKNYTQTSVIYYSPVIYNPYYWESSLIFKCGM
jgi:tetratricopeptide (TPR) repeat protein